MLSTGRYKTSTDLWFVFTILRALVFPKPSDVAKHVPGLAGQVHLPVSSKVPCVAEPGELRFFLLILYTRRFLTCGNQSKYVFCESFLKINPYNITFRLCVHGQSWLLGLRLYILFFVLLPSPPLYGKWVGSCLLILSVVFNHKLTCSM